MLTKAIYPRTPSNPLLNSTISALLLFSSHQTGTHSTSPSAMTLLPYTNDYNLGPQNQIYCTHLYSLGMHKQIGMKSNERCAPMAYLFGEFGHTRAYFSHGAFLLLKGHQIVQLPLVSLLDTGVVVCKSFKRRHSCDNLALACSHG